MNSKPSQVYNLSEMYNVSADAKSSAKRTKKSLGFVPTGGDTHSAAPSSRTLRPRNGKVNYADVEEDIESDRPTYAEKAAGKIKGVKEWERSGGRRGAASAARDVKAPVHSKSQDAEGSSRVSEKQTESISPASVEATSKAPKPSKVAKSKASGKTARKPSGPPESPGKKRSGEAAGSSTPSKIPRAAPRALSKAPGVSRSLATDESRGTGDASGTSKARRNLRGQAAPKTAEASDVAGSSEAVGGRGARGGRPGVSKVTKVPCPSAASKDKEVPAPAETPRASRAQNAAKKNKGGQEEKASEVDQVAHNLSSLLFGSDSPDSSYEVDVEAEFREDIEKKKRLREELELMTPRQQSQINMYESDGEDGPLSKARKEKRKLHKMAQQGRMQTMKFMENLVDLDKPVAPVEFTFGTGEFTPKAATNKTPKRKVKPTKAKIPASKKVDPPFNASTPMPENSPTPPPNLKVSPIREEPPLPVTPRAEQSEDQKAPIEDHRSPSSSPDLRRIPLPPHLLDESDHETEEERRERRAEELVKIEKKLIWERVYKRHGRLAEEDEPKWLTMNDVQDVLFDEAPKLWKAIERDNQLDEYGEQRAPLDDIVEWPDNPQFFDDFECPDYVRKVVNLRFPGFLEEF